jgi:DNA-binding transcriptional LysR family regulator
MNRSTENARFLKIGGSNSVSVDLLPKILTAFKRTHPEVEFVLETNNSPVIERRILNSELEIALVTNPSYSPLIAYEPYEELRLVAFAAPTSPMVGKTVTAKEFAGGPLVVRKGRLILEELVRRGYHPNVAAKCEATEVVKGTVQRGMGVGILHSKSVEHDIESGLLKKINVPELKKQFERRSFIIYDKRKPLSGVAQDLLELLHERAASRAQRPHKKARVGLLTPSHGTGGRTCTRD